MVAELGLRFRPSAAADLEAHAASIALLASDLADIPPHLLEKAIADHVRSSNFMPKAAELIGRCQQLVNGPAKRTDSSKWERRALEGNRLAIDKGHHPVMHWKVSPAGFGTEMVQQPMPREIYDMAMQNVDIAIFERLRA